MTNPSRRLRGRPVKPADEVKSNTIILRLSDAELAVLDKAVERFGYRSRSRYIRDFLGLTGASRSK